jgi:hypothetical protein
MMLIKGENEVYFVDRDNSVFQVENLMFPFRSVFVTLEFDLHSLGFFRFTVSKLVW